METFQNGIEIIRFANTILQFDTNGTQQEKEEFINDRIINAYKNYNPDLDKKVMIALLELYAERVPEQYHPDIYKTIRKNSRATTVNMPIGCLNVQNSLTLMIYLTFLKRPTSKIDQRPCHAVGSSVKDMGYELAWQMIPAYEKILYGERKFMAALMEMYPDKIFYPDANFTQRLSYGTIKGYQPRDAVWYNYFSTTQGVLEKETPGDPEFEIQPFILIC